MATTRRPQLNRPGQPVDALRERILQARREQGLKIPKQYDLTQESRPSANVDAGERPVPIRDNPRMTVNPVAETLQQMGGTATQPQAEVAPMEKPFSHLLATPSSNPRPGFPSQSQITAASMQEERLRASRARNRNILARPEVQRWRGLMGNDYTG